MLFWSENRYRLCPFWCGIGYGFQAECMNVFIVSVPNMQIGNGNMVRIWRNGRHTGVPPWEFNCQKKRVFSFAKYLPPPPPPCSMLGYNRTIMCTNIYVLLNIGPGARERRKKKVESSSLPNTNFDNDCSLPRWASNPPNGMRDEDLRTSGWEAFSDQNWLWDFPDPILGLKLLISRVAW